MKHIQKQLCLFDWFGSPKFTSYVKGIEYCKYRSTWKPVGCRHSLFSLHFGRLLVLRVLQNSWNSHFPPCTQVAQNETCKRCLIIWHGRSCKSEINCKFYHLSNSISPFWELTYPSLGKGKSSSKCHFWGDMLVPWRVIYTKVYQIGNWSVKTHKLNFWGSLKQRHDMTTWSCPTRGWIETIFHQTWSCLNFWRNPGASLHNEGSRGGISWPPRPQRGRKLHAMDSDCNHYLDVWWCRRNI